MLGCVVEILSRIVSPVCVVTSRGQTLPQLPADVLVGCDSEPRQGPLAGLLAGLKLLAPHVDRVFCSSCDTPLLQPDVVRFVISQLGDFEIAAPFDGKHWSPLCGVYRTNLAARIETATPPLNSPSSLIRLSRACRIPLDEIRRIDPNFLSLRNLNTPEEYQSGLKAWKSTFRDG